MKLTFPTSLIELHQWANSILLVVAIFFVRETYNTIKEDHAKLEAQETRITVIEKVCCEKQTALNTNSRNRIANDNGNNEFN